MYLLENELKTQLGARNINTVKTLLQTIPFASVQKTIVDTDEHYKLSQELFNKLKDEVYRIERTIELDTQQLNRIMERRDLRPLLCRPEFTRIEAQRKHHKSTVYYMSEIDLFRLWCYTKKKFVDIETDENWKDFRKFMKDKGVLFD